MEEDFTEFWSENESSSFVLSIEGQEDQLIGGLGISLAPNPYSKKQIQALVYFIYVSPEYRKGTDLGKRLIQLGEDWAVKQKAASIFFSVLSHVNIGKVYQKKGYVQSETIWSKSLIEKG